MTQQIKGSATSADSQAHPHFVLIVSNHPEQDYRLYQTLTQHGIPVQVRNSLVAGLQFLMVEQPDLLVIDNELEGGRGMEFCETVKTDPRFRKPPILMISKDTEGSPNEIRAFQLGVDDFIRVPVVPEVFLLRALRLIKRQVHDALEASLSVQVSTKELPGILQYLEAEQKTGELTIVSGDKNVRIYIYQGALVNFVYPLIETPLELITEVLSWNNCQVTFHEMAIEDVENLPYHENLTNLIMTAVVEVDEYREIRNHLPSDDVIFYSGKNLPPDAPTVYVSIVKAACAGYSVSEILSEIDPSERRATLWLHHLITEGYLKVGPPPFANYEESAREFYKNRHLQGRLQPIRQALVRLPNMIDTQLAMIGVGQTDWLSPVPRILVIGDNEHHLQLFVSSLKILYCQFEQKRIPCQRLTEHIELYRFDFGQKVNIEFAILPPIQSSVFEQSYMEVDSDVIGCFHFVSAQDRQTSELARRIHKLIRRRMTGIYHHVVSRARDKEGRILFKINCSHCGFKLAVDMEEAGFTGECPVCSYTIAIPDSLDNLYYMYHLPENLPTTAFDPSDALQVRDFLLLSLDAILRFCTPVDQHYTEDLRTELKFRVPKTEHRGPISIAETQYLNLQQQLAEEQNQIQTLKLKLPTGGDVIFKEREVSSEEQVPAIPVSSSFDNQEDNADFAPVPQHAINEADEDHPLASPNEIEEILNLLKQEDSLSSSSVNIENLIEDFDEKSSETNGEKGQTDDIDDFINTIRRRQNPSVKGGS